jgi:FKBP-type peptidyl-prolyl cis-trans isomerase FkpA
MRPLLALSLALALAACGDNGPLTNDDFDPSLGVDLSQMTKTASGLYYQDLVLGAGDPSAAGDTVVVDYDGFLTTGNMFDTGTITFILGVGQVIPGFDEGVAGMLVGGTRKLVIPPELAYGSAGAGGGLIPPNATLVFDVVLTAIDP